MPKKDRRISPKRKPLNNYVRYSAIGFQMAVIIFLFTWGGMKIDEWLGMKIPLFTLILSMFSIFIALYYFIKDSSKTK